MTVAGPISRQDIEDRFRSIQRDLTGDTDESKPLNVAAGAVGGAVALAIIWGAGRMSARGRNLLRFRRS